MRIRPELLQPGKPVFFNGSSTGCYSPTVILQPGSNNIEEMFKLIKAQCSKNAILFKKVVEWGIANNPTSHISQEEMEYLSKGRYWIAAHIKDDAEGVKIDSLDDIKGAYQ